MGSLLGQSPISTTGGIVGLLGLLMIILGLVFNKDEVWKAGIGIATAGSTVVGFAARDDRTATLAHQESLDKIEQAHGAHIDNQVLISHLSTKVESVPAIAAHTAQVVAAETAQAVVEEKLR
jgi:hypothetical protein